MLQGSGRPRPTLLLMLLRLSLALLAVLALGGAWVGLGLERQAQPVLRLASTTSTQDSGLLDYLLPLFEAQCDIEVAVVAKGTGAAIRDGLAGQVDALLVHNQVREEALVAEGYALARLPIMSNDFLLVGPKSQMPEADLQALLARFAAGERGLFFSRGDQSGTHAAEQRLWQAFGHDPQTFGSWYAKTGTGMGQTLITTNLNSGATLVDSATWARHQGRADLHVLHTGATPGLANPYGYLALNPDRVPGVNAALAEQLGAWLTSPTGQAAIASYSVGGMRAFTPASDLASVADSEDDTLVCLPSR